MADLIVPLLENQNQSDNVSITISPPLASPPPSIPLPSPTSSPLRSPNSSPNGLFVSLGSCCPRSILFNPRPAHVRPFRLPALSQPNALQASAPHGQSGNLQEVLPTDPQTSTPHGRPGHLQGVEKDAATNNFSLTMLVSTRRLSYLLCAWLSDGS